MNAEIMSIDRLRMGTDGKGITTLVVFHGCPLNCCYCINESCHDKNMRRAMISSRKLLELVKVDELYFRMTAGGITFGGGEPLLQSAFIKEFVDISPREWKYNIETSLNVPWEKIELLLDVIDYWIVDIKDLNDEIYFNYTGLHNDVVIANIRKLHKAIGKERLHIRVPYISYYNFEDDVNKSCEFFKGYGTIEKIYYSEEYV